MRRMVAFVFVAALLGQAPVLAHEHTPEATTASSGSEVAEFTVDTQAAGFSIAGYRSGHWEMVIPGVRFEHHSGLWASLQQPVAWLQIVGESYFGLSDLMATLGYRHGLFGGGLATMWPVGDSHQGLGCAHLLLEPYGTVRVTPGRWSVSGALSVRGAIAWGEHGDHNHQSLVMPHDQLDARATVRAGFSPLRWLELHAQVMPVVVMIAHPLVPVGSRVSAGAGVTFRVADFLVDLSATVPLTANRTDDFRVALGLGYVLQTD